MFAACRTRYDSASSPLEPFCSSRVSWQLDWHVFCQQSIHDGLAHEGGYSIISILPPDLQCAPVPGTYPGEVSPHLSAQLIKEVKLCLDKVQERCSEMAFLCCSLLELPSRDLFEACCARPAHSDPAVVAGQPPGVNFVRLAHYIILS
jgi:hypothetical protein